MEHTSRFARQINDAGFFAEITLALGKGPAQGLEVHFDPEHATLWQAGAMFGLHYAWNRMHGPYREHGVHVHVRAIRGHAVDTSDVIVASSSEIRPWPKSRKAREASSTAGGRCWTSSMARRSASGSISKRSP